MIQEAVHLGFRSGKGAPGPVILEFVVAGADEMEFLQTDEAEDGGEVWFEVVHVGKCASRMHGAIAGGSNDNHRAWRHERQVWVGKLRVKCDGAVDAHDLIDPCFHGSGHSKIVHGHTEHEEVSLQDFPDQFFTDLQGSGHRIPRWLIGGSDPCFIDGRRAVLSHIPVQDVRSGKLLLPSGSEALGEVAGDGTGLAATGIENKQGFHEAAMVAPADRICVILIL